MGKRQNTTNMKRVCMTGRQNSKYTCRLQIWFGGLGQSHEITAKKLQYNAFFMSELHPKKILFCFHWM